MLFNSFQFVIFFFVITFSYYALPHKYRWALLLIASCYFYMSFVPIYIVILAFTIVFDYFAGIYIERTNGKKRKWLLVGSLGVNIGCLIIFKYFNFFLDNVSFIASTFGFSPQFSYLSILLPIGLSFHTFQAMSYTIEVYHGRQAAEKHFGIYALYVMFYPQLVAGPIERPQNVIHQFKTPVKYNEANIIEGLQLMAWGFFKKVVIADRLAVLVDAVYVSPESYSGFTNFTAMVFFAIQIYCDFSGYSDIAIGSAKTLGIDLMKNFNAPYIAKSLTEFWTRWHISLSTWFRDYLYIPLGGNKKGPWKTARNLFIVFLVSGLWHGASWTFIVWGALHGTLILLERLTGLSSFISSNRMINLFRMAFTFSIVCCTWIFFRASSLSDALQVLHSIFNNFNLNRSSITECVLLLTNDNTSLAHFLVCICGIVVLFFVEFKKRNTSHSSFGKQYHFAFYTAIAFLILFLGSFKSNSFIYFQF